MELQLSATALLLFVSSAVGFLFEPRGPQMYPCLTYLERNLRVDCEFPPTEQLPGPYCEYRQDSRLVGSTYPNMVNLVSVDNRRRSNVSLVSPTLCRLTWAPMADEKPYTFTCRVYQGLAWKENSLAIHQRLLPICSALSVRCGPWLLLLALSLHMILGPLGP
ncbi:uncharacterized protein LOC115547321 [Gadus morhua]|uniref:uncharacterized protein LOC115547321 n=1 Tax=Gadus morhua TaxID=8049 RepID=UPI0011B4922E|nr:uncharacterized protein LOC115547321 [Gadus morhua]XP_030217332.1 uncharacterized protein LOC115547321 [Gadus morhua]